MQWNNHSRLSGSHAFLSASKYAWLNYDDDKLRDIYANVQAAAMGTRLHAFAAEAITLGRKQPRTKDTLNMYINDAIGFKMSPEVVLYFSDFCYGTADAISFRDDMLRIHDLKTGVHEAKFDQLYIYAAIFCHEYDVRPKDIDMELRIYQNKDVRIATPDPADVKDIMDKMKHFDDILQSMKEEV